MEPVKKAFLLKEQLDALRPLDPEREEILEQQFRLDWNFHSVSLEGNSLTYEEAKALVLFGLTARQKSLRDHLELEGHNEAVQRVMAMARDKFLLRERTVREWHALLFSRSGPVGKVASGDREFGLGQYKTQPRHGSTVTGETFHFANPLDTPAQMEQLVSWYREKAASDHVNAVSLAAELHYRFTRIHPFEAGNGPMARLLMNFVLLRFGFPPVIIHATDRPNYLAALQQADSGLIEMFVTYIAEKLIVSLELAIRSAKGEDLYGNDVLDRELALLRYRLTGQEEGLKNRETLLLLFEQSVVPLYRRFEEGCLKFRDFYVRCQVRYTCDDYSADSISMALLGIRGVVADHTAGFGMVACYEEFSYGKTGPFDFQSGIAISLHAHSYRVEGAEGSFSLEKSYTEPLTEDEMERLVAAELRRHKTFIETITTLR